MKHPKKLPTRLLLGCLVLTPLALFLAGEPLLLAAGDFLVVQDQLEPAAVIHVIDGPLERVDYAIQLYQQGYGQVLFFTGDWTPALNTTDALFFKQYALARGVPAEHILLDDGPINSTYSEAVRLRQFLETHPLPVESVLVVSDPHHMRRAAWTYRQVFEGQPLKLLMAPVPFSLSRHHRRWWTDPLSRRMVESEYLKLGFYYLRYQFSCGLIREWLAGFDAY